MSRSLRTFVAASGFVVLALGLMTWSQLDLQQRERQARDEALQQQRIGQALLRLDMALVPLLAGEAARWRPPEGRRPQRPLAPAAPFFACYFEVADDGVVTSPQDSAADGVAAQLARLGTEFPRAALESLAAPLAPAAGDPFTNNDLGSFEGRQQLVQNLSQNALPAASGTAECGAFGAGFLADQKGEPQMFFVRTVVRAPGCRLQGIWTDWPALAAWLTGQIADLLPGAQLAPASGDRTARRLASLPVDLLPGPLPTTSADLRGPGVWLLAATWIVVLAALFVVFLALRAADQLGERRAMFVSSVTHELRTPLTTFRMYAQMLADGMVPEASRAEYVATLRDESERLARIVESVLLYSRLEDGRGSAHRTTMPVRDLLARIEPLLRQRAGDAGRSVGFTSAVGEVAAVHVDPQAVEQILVNLVDNGCKYAPPGPLEVAASTAEGALVVTVRDPGTALSAPAPALFAPFRRGAGQAVGAIPGLGLGLAIARGLARAMGGELRLLSRRDGTTFELRLPLVVQPPQ